MPKKSRHSSSRKIKHSRKHSSKTHIRKTHRRKTHRRKTHRRKTHRRSHRRGGADVLSGAPVKYNLSGSWPSRMSLGQGADYFKYHEGQHGGALNYGSFPGAVLSNGLPDSLRGPAHVGGIDKAFADIAGLRDPPYAGGNRKNRHKSHKRRSKSHKRRSKSHKRRSKSGGKRRTRGGIVNANAVNANAVNAVNVAEVATNAANVANVNAANAIEVANANGGSRRRKRGKRGGALGYAPFPSDAMLLSSQKAYAQAGLNPEWNTDVAFTDSKIRDTQ